MTSKELNERIAEICDREDLAISGGKCIPYIGWYWREVDFDQESYEFGVINSGDNRFAGFMENNKWDYPCSRPTTPEEWAEIRRLLEAAVRNPTRETTWAVWSFIQGIAVSEE